jgi:hypothetical protein
MHLQRKIIVFPEGTNFANALVSARLEQTVCYKLPAAFSEKSTYETNCLVTSNVSDRSRKPPVAIWKCVPTVLSCRWFVSLHKKLYFYINDHKT